MPAPQNGQTHSNNSNCLSVFGHFAGLAQKVLNASSVWLLLEDASRMICLQQSVLLLAWWAVKFFAGSDYKFFIVFNYIGYKN